MFDVNKAFLLSTCCAILMRIFLTESDSKNCDLIYYKTSFHLKMNSSSNHIQKEPAQRYMSWICLCIAYPYWFTLTICLKITLYVCFRVTWAFFNLHHVYGYEPTCCYVNKTTLWLICRVSEIFIQHNKHLNKKMELETTRVLFVFWCAIVIIVVYCCCLTNIIYLHLKLLLQFNYTIEVIQFIYLC